MKSDVEYLGPPAYYCALVTGDRRVGEGGSLVELMDKCSLDDFGLVYSRRGRWWCWHTGRTVGHLIGSGRVLGPVALGGSAVGGGAGIGFGIGGVGVR